MGAGKLGGCGLSKSGWLDRADRPEQQQRADCFQHRLEGAVRILQVRGGSGCDFRLVFVPRRRLTKRFPEVVDKRLFDSPGGQAAAGPSFLGRLWRRSIYAYLQLPVAFEFSRGAGQIVDLLVEPSELRMGRSFPRLQLSGSLELPPGLVRPVAPPIGLAELEMTKSVARGQCD